MIAALERVASGSSVADERSSSRGEHAGRPYLNLMIATRDVCALWRALRRALLADPALRDACIVVREGDDEWRDAARLHHFDAREPIDPRFHA
ncbi:MAG: hypothetical protein H6713_20505 [Myxococcales bacterium]|nr:hypothetical protein [Myxococcales bacterium]MCB9752343.1 hypothetical protein [Myxococcales bacterium]